MISSLLAWDNTPRNLEEIRSPDEVEEELRAQQVEAEAKARLQAKVEDKGEEEDGEGDDSRAQPEEVLSNAAGSDDEGKAEGEGEATVEEEENEDVEQVPTMPRRKKYLHHPFTEKDYLKRKASAEYARIKDVEDRVLSFKKEGVKTYVISAGVLYGLGEAIFNHHFERAWKQDPQKLPIIGEGKNFVPTIHVKDLARMVKKIFEAPPE